MTRRTAVPKRAWLIGPLAIALIAGVTAPGSSSAAPVPGSQGTDTSLAATDSQVTVPGRGTFADLRITVNQTENLANQAVSITWSGGTPTLAGLARFSGSYLQIMQCWGDDDGTNAANPGPPAEQCVQGAVGGNPTAPPSTIFADPTAISRIMSVEAWPNFDRTAGAFDARTKFLWRPFRAVGGEVVDFPFDPRYNPNQGGNYWLNPYFNEITTNEIAAARTGTDGKGAELFEVHTGLQSSGLGCGQRVQPLPDGTKKEPQCWIVVVPRGTPEQENVGTPFADPLLASQRGVVTSPLSTAAWANRIAIPIEFKPVESPCALADVERRIAGSELLVPAIASWQPALCTGTDLPPYSYAPVSDATARQILATAPAGAPGLVVVSRPLASTAVPATSPVVYAPLAVSGIVIGFNLERNPTPSAPDEAQRLAGVRVAEMNLTPRLVAKLLTQSYRSQISIGASDPKYDWATKNPTDLGADPDFVRFNPEFELMYTANPRTFGGLQMPSGTSDAAQQVWEWILADAEARAWLDGEPDEWGMQVNRAYATRAALNSTGAAFAETAPSSFPKADPYCFQAARTGVGGSVVPPPLCGTDWLPYTRNLLESARVTRAASDSARIVQNPFPINATSVWQRSAPQYVGSRSMLAITDTPSAALYGVQMARLSRAGDNGSDRQFIAPDTASLTTGVAAMATVAGTNVLVGDPAAVSAGAYPLTSLTYAAVRPLELDATARAEYAAFIEYATGAGQNVGLGIGQLPRGYVPLPGALRSEAAATVQVVRTLTAQAAPTTTTTAPPSTAVTSAAPSDGTPNPVVIGPAGSPATRSNSAGRTGTVGGAPVVEPPTSETVPATEVPVETTPASTAPATEATVPSSTVAAPVATTPGLRLDRTRYAVVAAGVLALAAALGALEITKRTRRALPTMPSTPTMLDISPLDGA